MKLLPQHKTKADSVYEALRDAIVSGELLPGRRVVIREVAATLGVSEIPVREALKRLEADGLIVSTPYVGAVVSSPSVRELEEIMEIRGALESLAAALSARRLTPGDLDRLDALLARMEDCARNQEYWEYSKADREFHALLYSRCDNQRLRRLIEELLSQSERARAIFHIHNVSTKASLQEHREMLEALRAGDCERLAEAVKRQRERVRAGLAEFAIKGGWATGYTRELRSAPPKH